MTNELQIMDNNNLSNNNKEQVNSPFVLRPNSAELLPNFEYIIKAIKRQFSKGFIASILVLTSGIISAKMLDNEYSSIVKAIFDKNDDIRVRTGTFSTPNNERDDSVIVVEDKILSDAFLAKVLVELKRSEEARIKDIKKRKNVEKIVNLDTENTNKEVSMLRETFKDFFNIPSTMPSTQNLEELAKKSGDILKLRKNIKITTEPNLNIFSIKALAKTPEDANRLVSIIMNMYVKTELSFLLEKVKAEYETYNRQVDEINSRIKLFNNISNGEPNDANSNRQLYEHLSAERDEVNRQIIALEQEEQREREFRNNELNRLKSDYNLQLSRLQPDHPDVKVSRDNLQKFENSQTINQQLTKKLEEFKKKESHVRQRLYNIPIQFRNNNSLERMPVELDVLRNQLANAQQIRNLNLQEKLNLENQLQRPIAKGRIKIIAQPSYEPKASLNTKIAILVGSLLFSIISFLFIVFINELKCQLARDKWRVSRLTNIGIISQITRKSMKAYPHITPDIADNLRSNLGIGEITTIATKTLLSYRKLELGIQRYCMGKIIYLGAAGPNDKTSDFFFNFVNLYSTDTTELCVLVDCNHLEPVIFQQSEQANLCSLLEDVIEGKEIVVYKTKGLSFSIIQPASHMTGEKTRLFHRQILKKLLDELAERFDFVFVRSLPDTHFMENAAILDSCTDGIICIDAENTTFTQLERTLLHLPADKIRGLTMIGT